MKTFFRIFSFTFLLLSFLNSFSQNSDSTYTSVEDAFKDCLGVKKLDLLNQQLKDIQWDFSKFENLETLVLVNNPDIDFEFVLEGVSSCKKLTTLYLDDNKLDVLPTSLGKLTNLQTLELNYNNLKTLNPKVLLKLKNLNRLYIFSCLQLKMNKEFKTISKLPNLESLVLMQNNLTILPSEIKYCKTLRTLGLQENSLKTLPVEIGEMDNLEEIYLASNHIEYLPYQLNDLNLKVIDLSFNDINPRRFSNIKKMLPATSVIGDIGESNTPTRRRIDTPF